MPCGNDFYQTSRMNVLCTYQGSFSPPTLGHEDAARILGRNLIALYPDALAIRLLFMPTSKVGSKESISYKKAAEGSGKEPSDYVSETERLDMLNILCGRLNHEFGGRVTFEASDIEFKQPEKGTSTIHTLRALHTLYPKETLVLAMGEDNGRQLPWWSDIEDYPKLIDALLYVDREPPVDAKHTSALRYFQSYTPHKCCMRFDSGWPIILGGVKDAYEFPTIMDSADTRISDALVAIAGKTYLLPPPLPVSSTALRKALRSGNMAEAETIAGKDLLEYILPRNICTRTKDDVRRDLLKFGGRQKHTNTVKMAKALFDLPALSKRIEQIAKTYVPEKSPAAFEPTDLFTKLKPILNNIVIGSIVNDENYWKRAGIRMEDASDFAQCLAKVEERTRVVGSGAYGTMFDVPAHSCMKNIPRSVKHVGVKVEKLREYYEPQQSPLRVKEAANIAKKAAKLNIGPELYDVFVTRNEENNIVIVKVFELIDGKSWNDMEWKSPAKKHKAVEELHKAILTMNKAGIIHHDLHGGNVMVHKSGKIYIVDYDLARFVNKEEEKALSYFNDTLPSEYDINETTTDNGLHYIYTKLVEEGTIRLEDTKPANNRKTRKNKNNRNNRKA